METGLKETIIKPGPLLARHALFEATEFDNEIRRILQEGSVLTEEEIIDIWRTINKGVRKRPHWSGHIAHTLAKRLQESLVLFVVNGYNALRMDGVEVNQAELDRVIGELSALPPKRPSRSLPFNMAREAQPPLLGPKSVYRRRNPDD